MKTSTKDHLEYYLVAIGIVCAMAIMFAVTIRFIVWVFA